MTEGWLAAFAAFLLAIALLPVRIDLVVAADALTRRWRLRLRVALVWRSLGLTLHRERTGGTPATHGQGRQGLRPARAGVGPDRRAPDRRHRRAGAPDARRLRHGQRVVRRVLSAVRVERARLAIDLGATDAALTAVGCGAAWAVGGALLAALPGLRPERAELEVRPDYGGQGRLACTAAMDAYLPVWRAALLVLALRLD